MNDAFPKAPFYGILGSKCIGLDTSRQVTSLGAKKRPDIWWMFDGIETRKSSLAYECDDAESLLKNFLWHHPGLFPAVVRWMVYPGSDMLTSISGHIIEICLVLVVCASSKCLEVSTICFENQVAVCLWKELWEMDASFCPLSFFQPQKCGRADLPLEGQGASSFRGVIDTASWRIARGVVLAASTAFIYSATPFKKLEPSQSC